MKRGPARPRSHRNPQAVHRYKARLAEAQASGELRSLSGLCSSTTPVMRPSAESAASTTWRRGSHSSTHLLDPEEFELIEKATSASNGWRSIGDDSVGGAIKAVAAEPGAMIDSRTSNPEVDAVISAGESILDFKTQAVRDIEAGRIESIIEPRLADHVRREALKSLNELKRAV